MTTHDTTTVTSDIGESLRETATLVYFSARKWSATRTDREAVAEMASAAGAKGDVGRFSKNLLAGVDAKLKAVHSAIDAGRAAHYRLTSPWTAATDDEMKRGPRLLPNVLFMQYAKIMQQQKQQVQETLDAFVADYPNLVQQAAENLGGLYDPSAYPSAETIKGRFGFNFDFAPIPSGKDFSGLPPKVLERLGENLERRANRQIENAMSDLWRRTRTVVEHMVERLGDEDKKFHNTLVDNAKEMLVLMQALNIAKDPRMEEARRDLEATLTGVEPDDLRKNTKVRSATATEAERLLRKIDSWMGGPREEAA